LCLIALVFPAVENKNARTSGIAVEKQATSEEALDSKQTCFGVANTSAVRWISQQENSAFCILPTYR
jgi:hypothetical protein